MSATSELSFPGPDELRAHHAFLRRLARGLVSDAHRSEDVVQEAWAQWLARPRGDVRSLRAWMAGVVRHHARNVSRGDERRARREREAARPELVSQDLDGRLELEERLIQALRALEEPARSTLALRYYHDLGPTQIAEREGVSVNTIKARLRRGLADLRAELARRGQGTLDVRGLAALGFAGLEPGGGGCVVEGEEPGTSPVRASLSDLRRPAWAKVVLGLGAALAAVLVALLCWQRPPAFVERALPAGAGDVGHELELAENEPEFSSRSPVATPSQGSADPAQATIPDPPRPFEWPQYAGGPSHDNYRQRGSSIRVPRVLWYVDGALGQPTLSAGQLYSGGHGLFRIDAASGAVLARVLWTESEAPAGDPKAWARRGLDLLQELGYSSKQVLPTVAPAPAVGTNVVIARRIDDGGVSAFDRSLAHVLWRYDVEQGPVRSICLPGLLVDGLFVFENRSELLALDERTGALVWRFTLPEGDRVDLIPCAAGGRVFVGTEAGFVHALDLSSGAPLWSAADESRSIFGWSHPIVVGERLLLADRGISGRSQTDEGLGSLRELGTLEQAPAPEPGKLHAFDVATGAELWKTRFLGQRCSTPGVGRGFVVASFLDRIGRFDLRTGTLANAPFIQTATYAFGSPTVVGGELVLGGPDGRLTVYELETGVVKWEFRLADAEVQDFVHAGDRIYASTSQWLIALGDDPAQPEKAPGYVLELR